MSSKNKEFFEHPVTKTVELDPMFADFRSGQSGADTQL
jgi:hypothetical protein